jgi:hypothetical protein
MLYVEETHIAPKPDQIIMGSTPKLVGHLSGDPYTMDKLVFETELILVGAQSTEKSVEDTP